MIYSGASALRPEEYKATGTDFVKKGNVLGLPRTTVNKHGGGVCCACLAVFPEVCEWSFMDVEWSFRIVPDYHVGEAGQ